VWEEDNVLANGRLVIYDAMFMRELPRQDRSPTGRAETRRDEGVTNVSAFARHAIHVWRFKKRGRIQKAHEVVAMIVAKDENDVPGIPASDFLELRYGLCFGLPTQTCR
jgi:hypothetical protein